MSADIPDGLQGVYSKIHDTKREEGYRFDSAGGLVPGIMKL